MTIGQAMKLSIIVAVLLALFSAFYYYAIFIPRKEKARIEEKTKRQLAKEREEKEIGDYTRISLNVCLAVARANYLAARAATCKRMGMDNKIKDCPLPADLEEQLDQKLRKARNDCHVRYPP